MMGSTPAERPPLISGSIAARAISFHALLTSHEPVLDRLRCRFRRFCIRFTYYDIHACAVVSLRLIFSGAYHE